MIKFVFKAIKDYCQLWQFKKTFENLPLTRYLEAGTYLLILQNGRFYLLKKEVQDCCLQLLLSKKPLFTKKVLIRENVDDSKKFSGQAYMSTFDGYRYFDFKNCQTLKIYNTKKDAEKVHDAVNLLCSYFLTTYKAFGDNFTIETIINSYPRKNWDSSTLFVNYTKIFKVYTGYLHSIFQSSETKPVNSKSIVDNIKIESDAYTRLKARLVDNIKLPYDIDCIFCHGDLHFGNTLFESDNIYFIDFADAREEVFYYDLFNVMYVEFIDNNNSLLLDLYLNDDPAMMTNYKKYFEAAYKEFIPPFKIDYFCVYLLSRLNYYTSKLSKEYKGEKLSVKINKNIEKINGILEYINK